MRTQRRWAGSSATSPGAEEAVHDLLVWTSGIDPRLAPAIFSGTRLKPGIQAIRRICDAKGEQLPADVGEALRRLGELYEMRNLLVHYGVIYAWEADDPGQ